MLREKLRYLASAADTVVFSGSLPRAVDDDFYGELIRELNRGRRGHGAGRRRRVASARHGRGAVPRLAEPARGGEPRRAGVPRGAGLHPGARRHRGARRANVLITQETGCFALDPRGPGGQAVARRGAADRARLDRRLGRRAAGRVPRRSQRGQADGGGAPLGGRVRARPRRSRSAPAASTPARRVASATGSRR